METQHFQLYKRALASGDRRLARIHLRPFIESFSSLEERSLWTKQHIETEFGGNKIRHEIYEDIVFPVLLDGYRRSDPWAVRWLASTIQNLHQSGHLWEQIGRKSDYELLNELVSLCPNDEAARNQLLNRLIDGFQDSVHEWPGGVLTGINGASISECDEILVEVETARTLDVELSYASFLDGYEQKIREYRQRLTTEDEEIK